MNIIPSYWPISMVGLDRVNRAVNSVERALFPTTPELRAIDPGAVATVLALYDRMPTCDGPRPAQARVPRPFSRTRRLFGKEDTALVEVPACPHQDLVEPAGLQARCTEMEAHAAIVTESLRKAASADGLIPSVVKTVMGKIDGKALGSVQKSAKELKDELPQLAGKDRRLAEASVRAAEVGKHVATAGRVLHIAQNVMEGVDHLRAASSLEKIYAHVVDADYRCSDTTGECPKGSSPSPD